MHLSDHSLGQLDAADVQDLDEGALRGLSRRLLEDLKEARERLRRRRPGTIDHGLGVTLSVGVLDDTRREAGAAVAPLEDTPIAAVAASALTESVCTA